MQPAQPPAHRSHRVFWLGILASLVIASSLFGGCKTEPPQPGSPTPTPTPQLGDTDQRGDTPIVVKGGGSIDLEFDDKIFTATAKPVCVNCKIKSVTLEPIKDTGQPIIPKPSPELCGVGEITKVRIETKHNANDIVVMKVDNGVEIDPDDNYPGVISECADERKHHSRYGEIKGVKVNNSLEDCGGCTNWKRCKIVVRVEHPMPIK